jgi:hypothetical protein
MVLVAAWFTSFVARFLQRVSTDEGYGGVCCLFWVNVWIETRRSLE